MRSNNLPAELSSFVGRDDELTELVTLLGFSRLLTLVGPGGIGKTRLALKVAAAQIDSFSDGVWLVDLAPIADAQLVAHAVAQALDVHEGPHTQQKLDTLSRALRDRQMLLMLDNCEHLVETCAR
jgi:predicted ATPase